VTPFEETLVVLDEIVTEGKVRYVGSSNLAAWQVVEADWVARTGGYERFVSAQNKYSIYDRAAEAELVPRVSGWASGSCRTSPWSTGC
jgi:aryl-alcohol dehydrogenase-like predicted oxidoreductase